MNRLIRTSRIFYCTLYRVIARGSSAYATKTIAKTEVANRVLAVVFAILVPVFGYILLYTPAFAPTANAATNNTINFQARILSNTGALVADGNYHVEFKIYDSAAAGSSAQGVCSGDSSTDDCWWVETRTTGNLVTVKNGYVTANLGSVTSFPANMPWDQDLWLSMNIGGSAGGASWDGEMSPRMKITAVPFAQAASKLQNTSGANTSNLTLASPTVGDQNFVIQDQGAAGTFNICIQNSSACGFARLGSANTFTAANTFSAAGTALSVTNNATIGGTLGVTGLTTATGGLTTGANSLLTVGGATLNTTLAIADKPTGGAIGTAAATVDIYTSFTVNQTTTGQTLTIPTPTTSTTGRLIYITNIGTAGYTIGSSTFSPGTTSVYVWDSTNSNWNLVTSGGTGSYINNGTSVQTANFNIQSNAVGSVTATIQGAASQSANILEVKADSVANPLFSVGPTGATTYQNTTDSSAALTVKNLAGDSVLNVDTSAGTTTFQAGADTAPLGSELHTPVDFTSGDWTSTGWTTNATSATHTAGNTTALQNNSVAITAGNRYQVSFDISGTCTAGSVSASLGGVTPNAISYTGCSDTINYGITASDTTKLSFIPTTDWTGTISNVSIKQITGTYTPALAVKNASGTTRLEIRVSNQLGNQFIGLNSGQSNTTGTYNTASGTSSLTNNTTGSYNTANGYASLYANTTGSNNTASGFYSLQYNTTGSSNTASGAYSLSSNTTGMSNTASGRLSLTNNTTGSYNTASGSGSLLGNTTGTSNTASGASSLYYNSTGSYNTAIGRQAGNGVNGNSDISNNSLFGYRAGYLLQTGADNNILLGYKAGDNITTGANNIIIGYDLDAASATGDNQLNIGGVLTGNTSTLAAQLEGSLTVVGLSNLDGGIAVDTSNFTVSGTTGDVLTAGDLAVNGGNITSTGALSIDVADTNNFTITDGTNTLLTVADGGAVGNVTATGSLTAVGVNSGTGLIQGTGGLTVSGAAISLNDNSNFNTTINTGTSTGTVTIGNSAAGNIGLTSGGTISLLGTTNINTTGTAATTIGNSTGTLALLGGNSTNLVVGSGANTTTLNFVAPSGNNTISFPAETGTVCTTGSVCSGYAASATNGYIQLAPGSAQTDATTNSSIFINKTSTGNLLQLQQGASDKFVVDNSGTVTVSGDVVIGNLTLASIASGGTISGSGGGSFNVTDQVYTGALQASGHITPATDSTYNNGSSSLYWANTYTDRLYLNSTAYLDGATAGSIGITGNVGIGTTNPEATLAIGSGTPSGTQAVTPNPWGLYLSSGYDASFNGYTTFNGATYFSGTTLDTPLGYMSSASSNSLGLDSYKTLVLQTYDNRHKNADHGTQTNPTLYIQSATDPDTNNTQWVSLTHDQTNGVFGLGSGAYVFNDGNVGIGTTSPDYKLQVNGTIAPKTDSTSDLGASTLYFANTYTDRLYLNSTAYLDGGVAGTIAVTGDVTATGSLTAVGVSSGTGLLQGTGGLTVTGATSINATGAAATNIATGTGNLTLGNATGTFALTSNGGLNVSTGGALTGVSGITTTGAYTQSGTSANTLTGATTLSNTLTVQTTTATQDQIRLQAAATGAARFTGTITNADLTAARTYTLPNASGTFTLNPTTGAYLQQVPTTTAANTITPATASVVGLTVNGTSNATGATALIVNQVNTTATGAAFNLTNASGTQTNGVLVNRNTAGGTTTNLLNLTNTAGTATNALAVIGNYSTALNLTGVTAGTGINFSGASYTNLIVSDNFVVSAAGAVTAVGVNSGTGLIQGTGGLTVSGAAISLNDNSNFNTTINTGTSTGTVTIGSANAGDISLQSGGTISLTGTTNINTTGTANTAIGNATGTFALTSNGGLNVSTGGALTGVSGITTSGGYTQSGAGANTFTGASTFVNSANSATAFRIQDQGAASLFTANTLARTGGVAGNMLKVGNSTGTDTDTTLLVLDSATANPTTNLASLNGALYYNSTTNKISAVENGATVEVCTTAAVCSGYASTTSIQLQGAYNNSTGGTTPEIKLDSTRGALDIQDANTTISGSLLTVRASNGAGLGAALFDINSIGQTIFKNSADSTTAFNVQNLGGGTLFKVDTQNSRVFVGYATAGQTASAKLYFGDIANVNNLWIGEEGGTDSDKLQIQGKNGITLSTGTSADIAVTVDTNGHVGIGDTTPNLARLVVNETTGLDIFKAQNTDTDVFSITNTGSVLLGYNDDKTISVADRNSNNLGRTLTITAGAAGTGASAFSGGSLYLQGGNAAGTGNANGGNVYLSGGAGVGTGVKGLVVTDTQAYSTTTDATCATNCTITQANVDAYGAIIVEATATGLEITLPDPTISTAGRVVYVTAANGSEDFTLLANGGGQGNEIAMRENTTATMIWNGSDWTAAGASSSTTLQAAYDNTLTAAGGAEIVLNNTASANGLTVRNNASNPILGAIFETQTSIGSNLFSVNNNATEYATNGGAETQGASASTFPASTWAAAPDGGTVSRYTTLGNYVSTGQASVSVVTAATADQGADNTLASALTPNLRYRVSYAVRSTASFSTLDTHYSKDGTTTDMTDCETSSTVTTGVWTRIICTFDAPASGITSSNAIIIHQSDATARTFYIENLSVTISADVNHAVDGDVDDPAEFSTYYTAAPAGGTISRSQTTLYNTSGSAQVVTAATANQGVVNNLNITPQTGTQYLVTFYALSSNTFNDINVAYSRDGGTSTVACTDYNTQSVSDSVWTKVSCVFTTDGTTPTNADLIITQGSATARTFWVDALSVTLNTNTASNVQIGGGNYGGPVTLFTLDRSDGPPIAANNPDYYGSMYYDTTTGRIQCYESDGWGACGSPPDNFVNLNPEYAGAVLNGTGIGTMNADLCANQSGVLQVNSSLCGTGESKNFYSWTSPQATQQTYSIYVSYQLPSTFKGFSSDDTVQLTARVDNTTNAAVTYEMFRSENGSLVKCGTGETAVTSTANTWQTVGINGNEATGCGFTTQSAEAYVIFKINVKANSNANAYVSTLSFITTGK